MCVVNFVIDENNVNRITNCRKWLDSYMPVLTKRLAGHGYDIVYDRNDNFDLMHIHIPMTMAYRLCRNNNNVSSPKPVIYHGHMTEDTFVVGSRIKYCVRKWIKSIAQNTDVILCPSVSTVEYYQKLLPDKDVRQLNYGTDLNRYRYSLQDRTAFREQYGIAEEEVVVSCVGGLTRRKGVDDFFEVASHFPDIRFMWVGGSFYKSKNMRNIYRIVNRVDRIDFENIPQNILLTGYTTDVPAALSASDIFFFPSRHETQGLALVEAAANGRPIVARDLPVFREWLTHGVDCLMGECVEDFVDHIRALIQDSSLSSRIADQGLRSANQHHDINKTSKTLAGIYEEITG